MKVVVSTCEDLNGDHYVLWQLNLILGANSQISNYCTLILTHFWGIGLIPTYVSCLHNWFLVHLFNCLFPLNTGFSTLNFVTFSWGLVTYPKSTCLRFSQDTLFSKVYFKDVCVKICLGLEGSRSQGPTVSGKRCLYPPYTHRHP